MVDGLLVEDRKRTDFRINLLPDNSNEIEADWMSCVMEIKRCFEVIGMMPRPHEMFGMLADSMSDYGLMSLVMGAEQVVINTSLYLNDLTRGRVEKQKEDYAKQRPQEESAVIGPDTFKQTDLFV